MHSPDDVGSRRLIERWLQRWTEARAVPHRSRYAPVNKRPNRRAPWPVQFYSSAVGKKWVMALTGLALMGFVFFHAVGNLKVYFGAEDFNHYGEFLRELLVPLLPRTVFLWLIRIGLIVAFALHIHAAWSLTRMNRRSTVRATSRLATGRRRTSPAARCAGPASSSGCSSCSTSPTSHGARSNPDFVRATSTATSWPPSSDPSSSLIYIVANIALAIHLFHGAWSMFQSMGVNNPKWNAWRRGFAGGFAALILVMNVASRLRCSPASSTPTTTRTAWSRVT